MDEKKFPNGHDKEFCQMVLDGENSRFIPEDFLQYLKDKNIEPLHNDSDVLIKECNAKYFLKAMDKKMKTEFLKIIGQRDDEIRIEQVHPPCDDLHPHTLLGILYKFFIQKHIANVANTNCCSDYTINSYAAIFPFPVSDKLSLVDFEDGGISAVIKNDDAFTNEIQMFLRKHFDDVDLRSIIETFFANVLNCRANVIDEYTIWNILRDANILTEGLTEAKNMNSDIIAESQRKNILVNYPRLNSGGIERFQAMYRQFKDICELYEKPCEISSDKYDENYLRKLPEINFYELYSLLDVDIFNGQPSVYLYRFKKYIFFFVNALNSESKPVFFIDDMLFQSLLNYAAFKEPNRSIDVLDLKYELSLLSLVYLRKFRIFRIPKKYAPNEDNLISVKRYLDSFSNFKGVLVGRYIRTEVLDAHVKISTNEIVMDVRYKHTSCNNIKDFWALVLQGALMNENVQRLVIYNAYLGQETSIRMPDKQRVVEFIRRHNKYDFSKQSPPEEFITGGFEDFYEGNVANWDSKFGFNF